MQPTIRTELITLRIIEFSEIEHLNVFALTALGLTNIFYHYQPTPERHLHCLLTLQTAFAIAFQLLFADFRLVRCLQQTLQQTHSLEIPSPAPLRMCPLRVQLRQWHATSVALTACNMSDFCCTFWSAAQSIGGPYAVMQLALATLSGCQTPHSSLSAACVWVCVPKNLLLKIIKRLIYLPKAISS